MFCVAQKGDKQRLVFDCRQVNWLCKEPPRTHLSTPSALSNLRLSNFHMNQGEDVDGHVYQGKIHATDLVDSFYIFRWDQLCEFFCIGDSFAAEDLGVTVMLGDDGERDVLDPTTRLFACLCTLAKGWSWSMLFCHHILCKCMFLACRDLGLSREQAEGQILYNHC